MIISSTFGYYAGRLIIKYLVGTALSRFCNIYGPAADAKDVQGIQQREDLGTLVPIRGRGAHGQRHAGGIREGMDEETFAPPATRAPLTAACARGKTSHPRRRTAPELSRVPRRARGGALACRSASHQLASAAATNVRRAWRPIEGRVGDHTSGSQ